MQTATAPRRHQSTSLSNGYARGFKLLGDLGVQYHGASCMKLRQALFCPSSASAKGSCGERFLKSNWLM